MLGEIPIYGTYIKSIDKKNRINLPKAANVEEKEALIIYKEDTYFSIYNEECFMKLKMKEEENFERRKHEQDKLALKILARIIVTKGDRIIIPKQILEHYKIAKELTIVGADNHLNIAPVSNKEEIISSKTYTRKKKKN